MTDTDMQTIKLKPNCELAKALEEYGEARIIAHHRATGWKRLKVARAHLLEVIHGKLCYMADEFSGTALPDAMAKANEIMGVVSDD